MKLKLLVLLIAILFHSAFFKDAKRNRNKMFLHRLTNQLSEVKGFKTCNLYVDIKMKSTQMTDMLQSQLTKSFPIIVTIGKKNVQMSKFQREDFTQMINSKSRETKGLMTSATGNSILVAVVGWTSKYQMILNNIAYIYATLAQRSSIPKVLVISATNKKQNNKRAFKFFTLCRIFDVEILEISRSNQKAKGFLKRDTIHFTVHRCNPFLKTHKRGKMHQNNEWFEPKVNNLYGFELHTPVLSKNYLFTCQMRGLRPVKFFTCGPESYVASHFATSMNVTFVNARSTTGNDILHLS